MPGEQAERRAPRCPHSVGPVEDDEIVALGLYSTETYDPASGKLTPEAIKTSDLLPQGGHYDVCGDSSGLSVGRLEKPNGETELHAIVTLIVSRPTKSGAVRKVEGYSTIEVRELLIINNGIFSILDDGKEEFRTHAVVRAPEGESKGRLRLARNQLITKLNSTFHKFAVAAVPPPIVASQGA